MYDIINVMEHIKTYPEYSNYCNMKTRCNNPNRDSWKDYGGRGIKVCESWQSSFEQFYADMGAKPTPQHTIDRIDPNGDYCKDNCRWATPKEQAETRRVPIVKYCENCGGETGGVSRRGQCHKCNEYERRNGHKRPQSEKEVKRLRVERTVAHRRKPVLQLTKDGELVKRWDSVNEAIKVYGTGVFNVLSGRSQTCKRHRWKYDSE
jgi:hypothetical protein